MSNIEELLIGYRNINNRLAKNQELSEKIFKEITVTKVRKELNILTVIDVVCILTGVFLVAYLGYGIYKSTDNIPVFIMAIISLASLFLGFYFYYKPLNYKVVASRLLSENSIYDTILQIKEYTEGLKNARLWGILTMIPVAICTLPVVWYVQTGWTVTGLYNWHLEHHTLYQFLAYIASVYVFAFYFTWKQYDWTYFPILKKALKNLEELNG